MATLDNTTITTPEINGTYDGGMAVKQYASLIINNTVTTSHYGRGLTIFVRGDCIINGTLSVKPSNATSGGPGTINAGGVNYPIITTSGGGTLNAVNVEGLGTAAVDAMAYQTTNLSGTTGINFHLDKTGTNDSVDETGSGGKGGDDVYGGNPCPAYAPGAHRGLGLAFGGGGGGGGGPGCHGGNEMNRPETATMAGGTGSSAGCHGGGGGGGGAGLPAGGGGSNASAGTTSTKSGCLFLIVGGNLTGSGSIDLRGANGGAGGTGSYSGGGGAGSGGGVCFIAVKGTNSFCSTTTGTSTATHSGGTGNILLSGGSGGAGGAASPTHPGCAGEGGKNGYTKVVAMS
jgi:hypothetical protein